MTHNWTECWTCREKLTFEQEAFTWGADCYRLCGDCAQMVHNYIIHLEDEIITKKENNNLTK